jgi:hypothetical protein
MVDNTLVNMSMWKGVHCARNYFCRSAHGKLMKRRNEWLEHLQL